MCVVSGVSGPRIKWKRLLGGPVPGPDTAHANGRARCCFAQIRTNSPGASMSANPALLGQLARWAPGQLPSHCRLEPAKMLHNPFIVLEVSYVRNK